MFQWPGFVSHFCSGLYRCSVSSWSPGRLGSFVHTNLSPRNHLLYFFFFFNFQIFFFSLLFWLENCLTCWTKALGFIGTLKCIRKKIERRLGAQAIRRRNYYVLHLVENYRHLRYSYRHQRAGIGVAATTTLSKKWQISFGTWYVRTYEKSAKVLVRLCL